MDGVYKRVPMQQFSIFRIVLSSTSFKKLVLGSFSCELTGLSRRASEVVLGVFVPKMFVLEDDALTHFTC